MSREAPPTPATPDGAPNPAGPEADAQALERLARCMLCEREILTPAAAPEAFTLATFRRFVPRPGAELAQVLEHPVGESHEIAICNACSLGPFWTIALRAMRQAEIAREADAPRAPAGGKG